MISDRNLRFYMANIGSEVSRYFSYNDNGQKELANKSLERANDILERAIVLPEAKTRLYELEIISSTLRNLRNDFENSGIKVASFKNYFLPFAKSILSDNKR